MIFLVAYKLTPGKDYSALYTNLQLMPTITWWHFIDNVWLIKTDETSEQLQNRINPFLNIGADTLLIAKVDATDYKGWMPKEAHDWIIAQR